MPKDVVIGPCRLCLAVSPLRDSHIMPKWAYRHILDDTEKAPVHIADGASVLTNRQFKEYLLCDPCEGRLSKWEDLLKRIVSQEDASFPWLESLTDVTLPGEGDSSHLDVEAISKFACSVLWRASISCRLPDVSLGKYEEGFRRYLRGETGFPERTGLIIELATPSPPGRARIDRVFTMPAPKRQSGYHVHWFALCGVRFSFAVGRLMREGFAKQSFHLVKRVAITDGGHFREVLGRAVGSSPAKGSLAKRPL